MKRLTAAGLLVVASLLGAASASADPEILAPYCTGGQEPVYGECKPAPDEAYINDAPGADPEVALGVDPELVPVI